MSSRFEMYFSAKFPNDGKRRTSGLLHAAFLGKVNVIKHDSYFGLDIRRRSWLRNSVFRIRDLCLGLWTLHASFWVRARYRSALHPSQPVSKLSAKPVLKQGIAVHWSQIGPARFEAGRLASKPAIQLRNGLSCEPGLNVYTMQDEILLWYTTSTIPTTCSVVQYVILMVFVAW